MAQAVVLLVATRILGPHDFGVLAYALTVAALLATIPDYGFSLQLVKQVAQRPAHARPILFAALRAKLVLTAIAVLVAGAAAAATRPPTEVILVVSIIFASAIFFSFGQLISFAFRGADRFDLDAGTGLTLNVLLAGGALVALVSGGGVLGVAVAYLASRALYLALSAGLVSKLQPGEGAQHVRAMDTLRQGLPYGIHIMCVVVYLSVDTILLNHTAGAEAVGYYQAGMRFVMASSFVPEVLTAAMLPAVAARIAANDFGEARRIAIRMNALLIGCGVLIALVMIALPTPLRALLFGDAFRGLDNLLPGFGIVILLAYTLTTYGMLITAAGWQGRRTAVTVAAMILNVILNAMLIPSLGGRGALMAAIATQLVLLTGYVILARRCLPSIGLALPLARRSSATATRVSRT